MTPNLECFMCLYLLFFIGHMVHPYNHFLGYQVLVMDVLCYNSILLLTSKVVNFKSLSFEEDPVIIVNSPGSTQ